MRDGLPGPNTVEGEVPRSTANQLSPNGSGRKKRSYLTSARRPGTYERVFCDTAGARSFGARVFSILCQKPRFFFKHIVKNAMIFHARKLDLFGSPSKCNALRSAFPIVLLQKLVCGNLSSFKSIEYDCDLYTAPVLVLGDALRSAFLKITIRL